MKRSVESCKGLESGVDMVRQDGEMRWCDTRRIWGVWGTLIVQDFADVCRKST